MKQIQRIAALALVVSAALIGGFFSGKATDAGAAGTSVSCAIPASVVCTVSNPAGIKSVKVNVNFGGGIGNVAVVNNAYPACPKTVQVSWDAIVPNYAFQVEACSGLKVTNGQPPVVGERTTGMVIAIKPTAGNPTSGAVFLKNAGPSGDPKPLGLTSNPGTSVFSYPESCSWSQEGNTFVLCDQQYVLGCKLLGGTWTNDGCDGAHDNWPSDPPRP